MYLFMYLLGIFFGWQFYSLWLDIKTNTDDLKVMRCKNSKYVEKYNKEERKLEAAIEEQCKILRAIDLEKQINKLK